MPSQFFGLNIAYTGLLASNAAINTTGNNISNVQTPGFSRQQTIQQASNALRVFSTYGCAGAGVDTLAIERIRNDFYDFKFWNNNSIKGVYEVQDYYMKTIEEYFTDDNVSGFDSIFSKMMIDGIQEWMKNPGSETAKTQFIGLAQSLSEYFNHLGGNLQALQNDLNQEVKLRVDEINSLAAEIATLNKQINVIELGGNMANELRDRRVLLIDRLSNIVDVEINEYPIIDPNYPDRITGANRFTVKIASGQSLVDGNDYRSLECVARQSYEKTNQSDIDGLYDVYWERGDKFNLYNAAMGGALQGLIQLRDGNYGENFTGQIVGTHRGTTPNDPNDDPDTVTVRVTSPHLQDLFKSNLSDQGGIISLGNQEFYYSDWEYRCSDDGTGNLIYEYTFFLSGSELNDRRITNDRVGKEAEIGPDIKYMGIPYYMNQMNEWIRTFSQKFNEILEDGFNAYGDPGVNLFTGDKPTDKLQFDFDNSLLVENVTTTNPLIVRSNTEHHYYRLTAMNFGIVSAMFTDPGLLASRETASDGIEQNDLIERLKRLATDKDAMSFRGCSSSEFLHCILSDVSLSAGRASVFHKNFSNLSAAIETQRLSVSGVDEDEEALNLVKFQNGYNLASKMIQTLTEIYDRLILQTGV